MTLLLGNVYVMTFYKYSMGNMIPFGVVMFMYTQWYYYFACCGKICRKDFFWESPSVSRQIMYKILSTSNSLLRFMLLPSDPVT